MLPTNKTNNLAKRTLDVVVAFLMIIALLPIFLLVALVVRFDSSGPLFYRQVRVGRDGSLFEIWKFRTMRHKNDLQGPSVTSSDDCRITNVGKYLRHWKLDELPQLFNVLTGDMSLVGPRPQVPHFVDQFEPKLRTIVLRVRPGITGPTALEFRHEETMLADKPDRESYYIQHLLPVKLKMDVDYVQSSCMRGDLRILTKTVWLISVDPIKRIVLKRRAVRMLKSGSETRVPSYLP